MTKARKSKAKPKARREPSKPKPRVKARSVRQVRKGKRMTSKTSSKSPSKVTAPDDAEGVYNVNTLSQEAEPAPPPPSDPVVAPASQSQSSSKVHNEAVTAAEVIRQNTMATVTTQSAARAADIAYYQACRASAIANGVSPAQYITALKSLGTGGQ